MSSPAPPLSGPEDDVWVENAVLIKRLYLSERKTLKQVKETLENQHGFPSFPLSTYETKIRDKLRLRKKLKKSDWPAVYQRVREREGKETGVYINGMEIPWKKAWKEIRRSGYRSASRNQLYQLPAGVVVRTPSPTIHPDSPFPPSLSPLPTLRMPFEAQPEHAGATSRRSLPVAVPNHSSIPAIQYVGGTTALSRVATLLGHLDVSYHRVFLETIPINTFKKTIRSIVGNGFETPCHSRMVSDQPLDIEVPGDILHVVLGLNCDISSPMRSFRQLEHSSSAPALNFDSYHFLIRTIYLLSNKIISWENSSDIQLFDILFTRLPNRMLLQFFRSDIPNTRAVWETSVPFAWVTHRIDVLSFLLNIGLEHPDWILADGHVYLSMAASTGSIDTIRGLLKIGVRADDPVDNPTGLLPAIFGAIQSKSMPCIEALIQQCDVNRDMYLILDSRGEILISNFGVLISAITSEQLLALESFESQRGYGPVYRRYQLSLDDEMASKVLGMFLDHGADVDSRFRGLKEAAQITRPGICLSAKRGKEFLQAYLDSRPLQHPADRARLLELILAEQFFIDDCNIDTQVVQGLVDFGVDIELPTMTTTPTLLCRRLVSAATRTGFTDAISSLLRLFIRRGTTINSLILSDAITRTGLGVLPQLAGFGADISNLGGRTLCSAACLDNFEAVSWLLQAGVDINSCISTSKGTKTIIALVTQGISHTHSQYQYSLTQASVGMLAYLVRHGARLRLSPDDSSSYRFLKWILSFITRQVLPPEVERIEFFLDSVACPGDLATDDESLLSFRPSLYAPPKPGFNNYGLIYESLLKRGCPIQGKCQLAAFIFCGGRREIVYELLDAGADVNAYSKGHRIQRFFGVCLVRYPIEAAARRGDTELIAQLLKRGANINQPAIGFHGRTTLQSACEWEPPSIRDRARKLDLVKFLIDQGAHVNAPAAKYLGMTALQIAAGRGDIGTALILLEHGANVNAPPARMNGFCALDAAARGGRLDMVKLLLSMAAHSHDRGITGYEGAIHLAVENRHFAVAELIQEHIKTFGNCIIVDFGDGEMVDESNDSIQPSDDDDVYGIAYDDWD